MRKLATILLLLAALSTTACGFIPEFTDNSTAAKTSDSIPDSGEQSSGTTAVSSVSDSPEQTSIESSGTDTPDSQNPPESTDNPNVPPTPVVEDYTPISAAGDASLLSFHERQHPLSADQIVDCVKHYLPDVFTVSDASQSLLSEIDAALDGYAVIGEPCTEGGNYQVIFYRESAVEAVKSDTIWLTGTPAVQSKPESSESYDICTYALLHEKESGRQFAVFHASLSSNAAARAEEIIRLYGKYACYKDYFPTLLIGDLAGGDNSVLTAGGGLTQKADDLYMICMDCGVTEVRQGDNPYGTFGDLSFGETPYTLDLTKKLAALTFDDGPRIDSSEHAYTEAVLKTLEERGCKATFFVVGNRLEKAEQADLLRQEFAKGHEIGNHTYDHTSYSKLSASELMENLEKTDEKVRLLTGGIPTMLYRAPGGSNKTTAPLKMPLVNWSVDTEDWKGTATPESVFETFKKQISEGGIVLMHDLHKNSPDTLGNILTWLDENGYQAVTVSELFEFSNIQMDSSHAYYSTGRIKEW